MLVGDVAQWKHTSLAIIRPWTWSLAPKNILLLNNRKKCICTNVDIYIYVYIVIYVLYAHTYSHTLFEDHFSMHVFLIHVLPSLFVYNFCGTAFTADMDCLPQRHWCPQSRRYLLLKPLWHCCATPSRVWTDFSMHDGNWLYFIDYEQL